jgi:CRISPR system Cascade subunit CasB
MQEKISWTAESHLGKVLHQWWQGLEDDRASRAMLRRCATVDEVSLCPAYQRLYRYLMAARAWPAETAPWQKDKLAAIAGLLALIKTEDTQRLSLRMSESSGDKPLVSELRFRDLLKVETTDDLFTSLRRALPLIGHQASIHQLARDVYWWNDDTRKQWAYTYRWPSNQSA